MASVSTQSASKPSNLKNTQLTPNDRNAIFHYYMTLNKYFNTNSSENSPGTDRSNSSRAVKARKRLLNLHTYQFFELITDVNDEVERRTSSGQDTEYLLPQDDLHLKRNQARQKLANLSLKRFLDLVDDLSYEIRRRQYDLDPQFDEPVEDKSGFSDVIEQKEFETSPAVNNMGSSTTVTDHETAEKSITHKPSVQQVNVKKANMDWSDEEDEPVQKEVSGSIPKVSNQPLPDFNLPAGFSKQNASISRRASNGNIGLSLNDKAIKKNIEIPFANKALNENIEVPKINKTVNEGSIANNKDIALQAANKSINYRQDEVERNLQLKLDDLSNNNSSLVSKNAALNEENVKLKDQLDTEIQNKKRLTDELKNNEEIINHLKSQVETNDKSIDNEQYQAKNYINIVSDNKQLSIENEDLKQKITDLEIANKLLNTSEEIKTDIFDHGNMSNFGEEYFSKGMVPIESVKEFQVKVVDLSKKVQNYNPQQSNKDLFLSAIKLSDIVTSIVKSVEMQDTQQMYTEYCILANTSTTHLISTLKYQSKFSAIFPKIIIQNALLEILGSLYQLIYKAGCNMNNDDKVQSSPNASRQKTRNLTSTSISDISNDKLNGVDNKVEEKAQNEYTDSPVRPLKITQRMSSLPQIDDPDNFINGSGTSNSINKKHSNTGLFTGMLVTSSKTTSNDNIPSTSNKNIKGLSLNLKDSENINPPKLDKKQSQTILNRVKAFEETSFNEGHSTTRDTTIGNDSDVSLESKQQKRSPPKTVKEIDILQKRNSLQSIEDRVSAFGEMKTTKGEQSKKSIGVKQEDLSANVSTSSFEPTAEEKDLNNLLHYLENESIEVISTIQSLLTSIKNPKTTIKELNGESEKIMNVVSKVCRNAMSSVEKNNDLKTIGEYIITSLQDCERRMKSLIETESTGEYPDKSFKQRLAGIAFDIAKNVKKLVKVVEELSLKKEIAHLDQQLL